MSAKKTGSRVRLSGSLVTEEVTLYDRRTGKEIGKRRFTATGNACPKTTRGGAYALWPAYSGIRRWLKGQIR